MKFDSISKGISLLGSSVASLIKVALLSKRTSGGFKREPGKTLVILGNGPSLNHTLENDMDALLGLDLMAVNFAALSDVFRQLRPKYYMLADGHFFNSLQTDINVKKLWERISAVTWDMTLLIPVKFRHLSKPLLMNAPDVKVRYFNLTPVEGFKPLTGILYSSGLGMPRPRNVLIPAIMEGIRLGYSRIYLAGADHTWTKTLDVDDENFVVSVQPHFYKDNEEEHKRVRETYKGLKLHDVLGSMTIAFRSYWSIADYARKKDVEIINVSPGSMIDAFPRGKSLK